MSARRRRSPERSRLRHEGLSGRPRRRSPHGCDPSSRTITGGWRSWISRSPAGASHPRRRRRAKDQGECTVGLQRVCEAGGILHADGGPCLVLRLRRGHWRSGGGLNGFSFSTATAAHELDSPITLASLLVCASLSLEFSIPRSVFPIPPAPAVFE